MLQQYLQSNQNQNDTSENFCTLLEFWTERIPDFHTDDGKQESGHADDEHRWPNLHLDAGEGDAHG